MSRREGGLGLAFAFTHPEHVVAFNILAPAASNGTGGRGDGPSEGGGVNEADRALIARLRQGDHSALDTLVRQHQNEVYRLAYRMTRNGEDAKDISQEAFLRAYRALASFDGRSSLSTWLYRITVNLCLTHLRHQRSGSEGEMAEGTPDPAPPAASHAPAAGPSRPPLPGDRRDPGELRRDGAGELLSRGGKTPIAAERPPRRWMRAPWHVTCTETSWSNTWTES